jgi:Tfp pilus assembly protein PilW
MVRNSLTTQNGFSLVELILYVGLMSFILVTIGGLLTIVLQSANKNQAITEVNQQGLQVMQIMTQSIRNSKQINAPLTGNSGSSLSVNTTNISTTPTIFLLSSGVVQMTEGFNSAIPLTNSQVRVSNLSFKNLANSVRIQFTIQSVNPTNRNEFSYQETFYDTANLRPN